MFGSKKDELKKIIGEYKERLYPDGIEEDDCDYFRIAIMHLSRDFSNKELKAACSMGWTEEGIALVMLRSSVLEGANQISRSDYVSSTIWGRGIDKELFEHFKVFNDRLLQIGAISFEDHSAEEANAEQFFEKKAYGQLF